MSQPICWHCAAGCSCLSGVKTYLPALCSRGAAVKVVSKPSAETVLQRCSCLSGVETYLPALCCSDAAVKVVSKPFCRDCVAGVQLFKWCRNLSAGTVLQLFKWCRNLPAGTVLQLFKWCRNLSAGTVLQGCSCLSGVETFLPAQCCRGAAV